MHPHPHLPPAPTATSQPAAETQSASLVPPHHLVSYQGDHVQASCLFNVLARAQNLKGSRQVFRSRVLNALHLQIREFEEARLGLVHQFGRKNDKGELIQKQVAPGMEVYDMADRKGYEEALAKLKQELPITVDGSRDVLLGKALGMAYDLLHSDDCPPLAPPRPGQAMHECEAVVFAQVIDGFTFTRITDPPR